MNYRHAYLILAHNNWDLLMILLELIDDPRNDIFLHIDKKANSVPKKNIMGTVKKSKIYLTKQYDITWGGNVMTNCELNMLKEAKAVGDYTYYHLLSGVDLPLMNQNEIHQKLDNESQIEYISFEKNPQKNTMLQNRVGLFYFGISYLGKRTSNSNWKKICWKIQDYSLAIQCKLGIWRNKEYENYKGSQWFSITDRFASILLQEKAYIQKRYRFTMNADEHFLQNIYMKYEKELSYVNSDNHYIKWDEHSFSPRTIQITDWEEMLKSGAMFARKFDPSIDFEVIKKLHYFLSKQEGLGERKVST